MGQPFATFLQPGVMFIGAGWVSKEFRTLKIAFQNALKSGYKVFHEPAVGSFAMCHTAQQAGWDTGVMYTSDVSFFSTAMGYAIMGKRLDEFEPHIDGLEHEDLGDPAVALWGMMMAIAQGKEAIYWKEIGEAMYLESDRHVDTIRKQLDRAKDRLHGVIYEPLDMWEHMDRAHDDPTAIMAMNPPSVTAGYEKFYDTKGRFTWKEPSYPMFDVSLGYDRLLEYMSTAKCLVASYMELPNTPVEPGTAFIHAGRRKTAEDTGFVRSIDYCIVSNRPDELAKLANGIAVYSWQGWDMTPVSQPVLTDAHMIDENSELVVAPLNADHANYYRALWSHLPKSGVTGNNCAMWIDGRLAGIFGYSTAYLDSRNIEKVLLLYGMVAPGYPLRLTRLQNMVALSRETLSIALNPVQQSKCNGVITSELTRYPEAKEYRGIMKLDNKKKDPRFGWRLNYHADIDEHSLAEVYQTWLQKERVYSKLKSQTT